MKLNMVDMQAEKMELLSQCDGSDDDYLPKPPLFSTFLFYHILYLMHYHFELGFRLELFVPYEFAYIFWYFGEVVVKSMVNLLERKFNLLYFNYEKCMTYFLAIF